MAEQITIRRKVSNSSEELEKLRWFGTVGYLDHFNISLEDMCSSSYRGWLARVPR